MAKRVSVYDKIAPSLNDIYCFYFAVGNWKELEPKKIIQEQRDVDKQFYIYKFLYDKQFENAYFQYKSAFFAPFTGVGLDFKLLLNKPYLRGQMGDKFKSEWVDYATPEDGVYVDQQNAYQGLMTILAREIEGGIQSPKGSQ